MKHAPLPTVGRGPYAGGRDRLPFHEIKAQQPAFLLGAILAAEAGVGLVVFRIHGGVGCLAIAYMIVSNRTFRQRWGKVRPKRFFDGEKFVILYTLKFMLDPEIFNAVISSHGLYNSEQFVLRLSPKNHALIANITSESFDPADVDDATIQAYSTYIHETIHWWQHIGSTTGLVLSLCYPLQLHSNLDHVREWCSLGEASKSIRKSAMKGELSGKTHHDARQAAANVIVNNTMDFEFFKSWLLNPDRSLLIYNDPYFVSQGHIFRIVYSGVLNQVSKLIDPTNSVMPNPERWVDNFDQLKNDKVTGYYFGSPMFRRPVGVREIFEGQACFCQMQFLANSGLNEGCFDEFKKSGMLHGVYQRAFEEYLKVSKITPPENVLDPKVGLFLLICDLSINPMEGFPCEIRDFPSFVNNADPGIRFLLLCNVAARHHHKLINSIKDYTKDEYLRISLILSGEAGLIPPSAGWDTISSLVTPNSLLSTLMKEHKMLKYYNNNVVLRVLLSHFVSFTLDKRLHPHFFCWPGHWKANTGGDDSIMSLWLKNLSLFSDQEHDDGIFIRNVPGVADVDLKDTINRFFGNNIISDLSRQWVLKEGEFSFNFKWLSEQHRDDHWRRLADEGFETLYGIRIVDIKTA